MTSFRTVIQGAIFFSSRTASIWTKVAVLLVGLALTRFVGAGSVLVPAELQAELLSKLVAYDRNFEARAGSEAVVLLLVRPKYGESTSQTNGMKSALARMDRLGGLKHREIVVTFQNVEALAKACRAEHASVIYVPPGFDDQVEGIATTLSGIDVLTLSPAPEYVPRGVVLGFELAAGKPKLVLNLPQAKKQNVNFSSDVMKFMRVYR